MRKTLFALLLAACGGGTKPTATTAAPPSTTTADTAPTPTPTPSPAVNTAPVSEPMIVPTPGNPPAPAMPGGKPEIGTWGFDIAGMDTKVSPGASFYQYGNGGWLKNTPIPDDKSNYGM